MIFPDFSCPVCGRFQGVDLDLIPVPCYNLACTECHPPHRAAYERYQHAQHAASVRQRLEAPLGSGNERMSAPAQQREQVVARHQRELETRQRNIASPTQSNNGQTFGQQQQFHPGMRPSNESAYTPSNYAPAMNSSVLTHGIPHHHPGYGHHQPQLASNQPYLQASNSMVFSHTQLQGFAPGSPGHAHAAQYSRYTHMQPTHQHPSFQSNPNHGPDNGINYRQQTPGQPYARPYDAQQAIPSNHMAVHLRSSDGHAHTQQSPGSRRCSHGMVHGQGPPRGPSDALRGPSQQTMNNGYHPQTMGNRHLPQTVQQPHPQLSPSNLHLPASQYYSQMTPRPLSAPVHPSASYLQNGTEQPTISLSPGQSDVHSSPEQAGDQLTLASSLSNPSTENAGKIADQTQPYLQQNPQHNANQGSAPEVRSFEAVETVNDDKQLHSQQRPQSGDRQHPTAASPSTERPELAGDNKQPPHHDDQEHSTNTVPSVEADEPAGDANQPVQCGFCEASFDTAEESEQHFFDEHWSGPPAVDTEELVGQFHPDELEELGLMI